MASWSSRSSVELCPSAPLLRSLKSSEICFDPFVFSSNDYRLYPIEPGDTTCVIVFRIEFPVCGRAGGDCKRDIDGHRTRPREVCEGASGSQNTASVQSGGADVRAEHHRLQTWVAEIKSLSLSRNSSTSARISGGRRLIGTAWFSDERIVSRTVAKSCSRTATFLAGFRFHATSKQPCLVPSLQEGRIGLQILGWLCCVFG